MSKRRYFGKGFVLSVMTLLLLQCCGSVHKALARSVSAGRPVGSQSGLAVGQRIVKASLSSYQWAFMIPDLQKLAEEVESGDSRSLLIPPPGGIKKPWKSLHKLGTFAIRLEGENGVSSSLPLKEINTLCVGSRMVELIRPEFHVSKDLSAIAFSTGIYVDKGRPELPARFQVFVYRSGWSKFFALKPPHMPVDKLPTDDDDNIAYTPCALSLSPHGHSCAILYAVSGKEYLYMYSMDSQTGSVIWTSKWPKGRKMAEYAFLWHGDQLYFTPFDGGPLLKLQAGNRVSQALKLAPLRMFPESGICFVGKGKAFAVKALELGTDGTVKIGRTYCVTEPFDRTIPEFGVEKAGPTRIMIGDGSGQIVTKTGNQVKISGGYENSLLIADGTSIMCYNGQANDTLMVLYTAGTPFHPEVNGIELGPTQKDGVTLFQVISGVPVSFYFGHGGLNGRPEDAYLRPARADSNARSRCPLIDEKPAEYRMP